MIVKISLHCMESMLHTKCILCTTREVLYFVRLRHNTIIQCFVVVQRGKMNKKKTTIMQNNKKQYIYV